MRMRKKAWAPERLQELTSKILVDPTIYKGQWKQYFQNNNPLHVEVGTGKGRFISTLASQNPDINFIGVEYVLDIIYYAAQKVTDLQLGNVSLACFDVNNITDIFNEAEIDRLYINFCDPWPKKRHAKRRLTHLDFLARYKQILVQGGEIHFKTDNEQLFEFSLNQIATDRDFQMKNISLDFHTGNPIGNVMTEYEEKFSSIGMKIFRCEAVYLPIKDI